MKTLLILLVTTFGNITIELDGANAPKTVDNFVRYVNEGHYNGTTFHRVIDGFMIQGGGFTAANVQKSTHAPIRNESNNGLKNVRGTISMARTGDPHSATAQFFINTVDNRSLDYPNNGGGYAVFGRVVEGMEVVDRIEKVRTGMQDRPLDTVLIKEARVIDKPAAAAPATAPGAKEKL